MGSQSLRKLWPLFGLLILIGCAEEKSRKIEPIQPAQPMSVEIVETPEFNADSAYQFVKQQVAFGPRVPNTPTHKACAQWLEQKLKSFGLETHVQNAEVTAYNKEILEIYNISGRYKPEAEKRILLCAHWDSRPYADRDIEDKKLPIDGANDGASGVGVLLELARIITSDSNQPDIGFDIVLFDAEDYGKPQTSMYGSGASNTWCLGSQHWAANLPFENYQPEYGILLDMVGASNAVFPMEGQSLHYAPKVVDKVWSIAQAMGYKNYFTNERGSPITDDHVPLNKIAGIPTIDIIHYEMFRNDFGHFHHTHKDNMDVIDRGTLGVVGNVLLQVIYKE